MPTEEDTFNAIRRPPFQETRLLVRELTKAKKSQRIIRLALKKHGWSWDQYNEELARHISNELNDWYLEKENSKNLRT